MEGQQLKSENDFGLSFSLESSEAKKIIAKNSREEKRLDKVRKSLEKQQTAEEKKRLKAQKQTLINFLKLCGRNSSGKIWFQDQRTTSTGMSTSRDQFSSRSEITWEPLNLIAMKNNSHRHKVGHSRSQMAGFDYSPCNESVSFFIFPDMQRILASKEYFVRRSQSWCSETAVQHKVCLLSRLVGKNGMKGNSTHRTQRNFIRGEVRVKSERQGKERNLCDVLPPVVLPPLYSQKNKTLGEKRLATLKRKDQDQQDALWDGLEDCRYIRTCFKKN